MSLERKDVCAKLDPDMHRALKAICEVRNVTIGEFIESLLVPEIKRIVHESISISEAFRGLGKPGNHRE